MPLHTRKSPGHRDIQLWTPEAEVEAQALQQLDNIAALPWAFHHVAVMPDVHYGKGATVGSVIAMKDALAPAAVGVDIGCGMGAIRTRLKASDLADNLESLRSDIEAAIPVGFNSHDLPQFQSMPDALKSEGAQLFSEFKDLHPAVQSRFDRAQQQIGTLGGGNHFIELCLDDGASGVCHCGAEMDDHSIFDNHGPVEQYGDPSVWMMLHSGSRNIGKELAEIHIDIARKLAHNAELPDRDLAVFMAETPEMAAYRHDLLWAQRYAMFNRRVMFELYKYVMCAHFRREPQLWWTKERLMREVGGIAFEDPILCHHNYVSEETHFGEDVIVTRKGAISARKGELGIIPGSMGTKSYIVRGLGNPDSFHSASHGAGRRMSRSKANKTFTLADIAEQTKGVCCRKDVGVIDEAPLAYKDIDQVMRNQADLVEVVATLKQVLCVKG